MSRFSALKADPSPRAAPTRSKPPIATVTTPAAKARDGKKPVMGYYSPTVRRALHQLALDEGTSIQALLGEALDLLMRARGKHPFGER